jgi:hypothetical protein
MKTWFVTNVQPSSNGAYDTGLAAKLNQLEEQGQVIWNVVALSGQIVVISYTEG